MFIKAICIALLTTVLLFARAGAAESDTDRTEAKRQEELGNYRDAADIYRRLALEPGASAKDAASDALHAFDNLIELGLPVEAEAFLIEAEGVWKGSWRLATVLTQLRLRLPFTVEFVDNEPVRTDYWSYDGKSAAERDRVHCLNLMLAAEKALDAAADPADEADKAAFYTQFAEILTSGRRNGAAWRLTALTDPDSPPDYEDYGAYYGGRRDRGAPVDGEGNPVLYPLPASWEEAANDGQRWRWLLDRIARHGKAAWADFEFAEFLVGQFGVQTMGDSIRTANDGGDSGTGAFAVRTLADSETIARLATGPKRFSLPEEYNFIAILSRLAAANADGYGRGAYERLARIYENRQQFAKAVAAWEHALALAGGRGPGDEAIKRAIGRITGNNGMLEAGPTAPAGSRTRVPYLFRNGGRVKMTAMRLNEKKLLADIRAALKADGADFFDNPVLQRPQQFGRWVAERDLTAYVAERTAEWEVELEPLPDHYSRRVHLEMPFEGAGCYLVEAAMENGNTSRVVLWLADLALVRKTLANSQLFYVADAADGRPAAKAKLSFLGYSRQYRDGGNRPDLTTSEFAEYADDNGLAVVPSEKMSGRNWIILAETEAGGFAFLGFTPIWSQRETPESDRRASAFIITDRPVYRPDQAVNFKIWLGQPSYGDYDQPYLAGREMKVVVTNPMGETIYDKTVTADARGGFADSLTLDGSAPLGGYSIQTAGGASGYGSFQLEEYKKPEFEVTVETPDKALILGDGARVKVAAKYYFGSPVTDARVSYRIVREAFANEWFPPWRWDWLYGSGSSWQSYDYSWLPGWRDWGVSRPLPAWMPRPYSQPELVADGEGTLDEDGFLVIPLDTGPAKELFGHQDHKYTVTVEVTDQSRRLIAGTGEVVAARKPFAVTVWADRGYYATGQEMRLAFKARRPLGAGVAASGRAILYRLSYAADGRASETEVGSWDIATDANGDGALRLQADIPGQYRLSCTLTDAEGNAVEGAAVATVRGESGEGDFRFAALELVADKREYQPGDTVRLAVNSEKKDAVVLLFVRAERMGGAGGPPVAPSLVRLENGGGMVEVAVNRRDQPNFFCEAVTIHGGGIFSEVRQIFVPPAAKTLNVAVAADRDDYLPGSKANFTVKITDLDARPVSGQCVVSIYDKSIEYISGGSNVGDIRAHFWKWTRNYHANNDCTLKKRGYRVARKGDVEWEPIGMFGGREADWNDDGVYTNGRIDAVEADMMVLDAAPAAGGAPQPRTMRMKAAPMSPPSPAPAALLQETKASAPERAPEPDADGMAETAVRSEFADTALWLAALDADENGVATFSLDMPENLTAWKSRVWVMGPETRVGDGEVQVTTRKNVIVRPQAPRFLTQTDEVVLSANLHNYLPRAKSARAELVLEGGVLEAAAGVELTKTVELAAGGEARVDWLVTARRPGEARIVMRLLTDEESDAAEIKLPVVVHGARRVESFGGVVRGDQSETTIKFLVPEERLADRSRLEFSFSPSIAASLVDALPYLVDYPYGCTEQTLNRFLPAVMTRKYLEGLGLSLADATKADESPDAQAAAWLKTFGDRRDAAKKSPVFDDKELAAMSGRGVERLASMQNGDGGWGWFSGSGERSWPHTTAVVVHGLLAAVDLGVAIPSPVVEQGVDWLRGYQERQITMLRNHGDTAAKALESKAAADDLDAFVAMILSGRGRFNASMRDFLFRDRLKLSQTGLVMLGLALHAEKATDSLDVVLRNLDQFVQEDAENGTAWLRLPHSGWWWWYNDEIETQAWYLKLLARVDPKGARASGLAKYLLRNRKNGAYWRSTRDTAYAVEALTEYAVASGETSPDMTVALYLDGVKVMERALRPENILDDNRFVLEGVAVEAGAHEFRLVRTGGGNLYYGGSLDVFSLEDPIAKAGLELKVERAYYRLDREDGAATAQTATGAATTTRTEKHRRVPMPSPFDAGSAVGLKPGDLVEVELTVEAKNDYEYLVFEDMKAAGLESVALTSGYDGNRLGAYVEYRDRKVVLFVRHLPRGKYSLSYRFRAETPGAFSALPTFGGGMYATDLFCNSDEMKVRIAEEGTFAE